MKAELYHLFIHKLLTQTFLTINFTIFLCKTVHSNRTCSQVFFSECTLFLKKRLRLFVVRDRTIHRTKTPYPLNTNIGLGVSLQESSSPRYPPRPGYAVMLLWLGERMALSGVISGHLIAYQIASETHF